jgi:hypothetical protein
MGVTRESRPQQHCPSWYKTATGKVTNNWSGFTRKYRWATRRVRFEDYRLVKAE